ncbi:hypothetical protein M758_10G036400 [Ceratodon purpureus]|nr:hypothetical protein M758_10G036400 [Ceratodon purpureus]
MFLFSMLGNELVTLLVLSIHMYACLFSKGSFKLSVETLEQIHLEETPGDILLFLTGQEEIESMERLLKERASHLSQNVQKLLVVPIYAALPSEQQMRVFQAAPEGTRKVILATNIAETSLTIPGIRYVIDPGLVKARAFNPRTGVESLEVVPVSKAQAQQRRARKTRKVLSSLHRRSIHKAGTYNCSRNSALQFGERNVATQGLRHR